MCAQKKQDFAHPSLPPLIHTPNGEKPIAAFDLEDNNNGN